MLLQAALGMELDAAGRRITFSRPCLPESVERIHLTHLALGSATVDLHLERHAHDVAINVVQRQGNVEIVTVK